MAVSLHQLLKTMIEMGGSDLHITTNSPPQIRVDGKLRPLDIPPLTAVDTKQIAYSVLTDAQKHRFEENLELDFSFGIQNLARFRGNAFKQRGCVTMVVRQIPFSVKTFDQLKKVERPDTGDDGRAWGPPFWNGESTMFLSANAGKRSLAISLRDPRGREAIVRLAETADVFLQSLRPGLAEEIGLGPDVVCARNPLLVYCSVGAYGHTGPLSREPGYDALMQAAKIARIGIPDRFADQYMTIVAPCDAQEMKRLMTASVDWPHPLYIRLAKGGDAHEPRLFEHRQGEGEPARDAGDAPEAGEEEKGDEEGRDGLQIRPTEVGRQRAFVLPQGCIPGAERARIAIEEGARAEYWMKSRQELGWAWATWACYGAGLIILAGILLRQGWNVARAAGWW